MLRSYIILIFAFFAIGCSKADIKSSQVKEITPIESPRERIVKVATSYIGQKEKTGHNDGPFVRDVLASTGLPEGYSWCASYCVYVYKQAGLYDLIPHSALASDLVRKPFWIRGKGYEPRPGDVFGIRFHNMNNEIHHVGIIIENRKNSFLTNEGNTNDQQSREGNCVAQNVRFKSQVDCVQSYIQD